MALTTPIVMRAENRPDTPLGRTMNEIRTWLDTEKIQPANFKTIVSSAGFGFEISFKSEREAERFQQRFPALLAG